jgi:predicted TIM-barrel fold metal-dependent hydrolase
VNDIVPVLKDIGPERLIFGSDFPEVDIGYALATSDKVCDEAGFTEGMKEHIFSGTLISVLGGV